jgi:hypothetical protein
MEDISDECLKGVEADSYHCLTNMLDNAQVCSRVFLMTIYIHIYIIYINTHTRMHVVCWNVCSGFAHAGRHDACVQKSTSLCMLAQDNYVMDSKGIQEKVFILRRIIARLDDKLFAHLEAMEVEFLQVCQ